MTYLLERNPLPRPKDINKSLRQTAYGQLVAYRQLISGIWTAQF